MRRFFIAPALFFIFLIGPIPIVEGANIQSNLMSSQSFYQSYPRQQPLAEQFSSIVTSPANPLDVPQKKVINVALLLFGDIESMKNRALLWSFEQRMRELRIDYHLAIYLDASMYADDLDGYFRLLQSPPDYVVVTELHRISKQFVEHFLRAGKPKVIFYDLATPLTHWMNYSPLIYIGSDETKAVQMLASYLDRQLPSNVSIASLILSSGYLSQTRCDVFLDEMTKYHRIMKWIKVVEDNKDSARQEVSRLLKEAPVDFVFSCSQNISDGVIEAIEANETFAKTQTNSWGLATKDISHLQSRKLKASVLFMRDDLSIAVAEAIKLDMEGRSMPKLYVAHASLMPAELDSESLHLMMQRAYRYSAVLWSE